MTLFPYASSAGGEADHDVGTAAGAGDGTGAQRVAHGAVGADRVVGYRLVRKLGAGERADVFLAAADILSTGDAVTPAELVALKLYRAGTSADSVAAEVDALARIQFPHCVRLIDYATTDSGQPVLVLSRAARGSVARLLQFRGTLALGEAVTIVAPIAQTVAHLNLAGVAHSRLSAATVHFGDSGEPILLGFGHAQHTGAAHGVAPDGTDRDREALALFARFVLAAVAPQTGIDPSASPGESVARWIDVQPRPLPVTFPAQLAEQLFDSAPGTAVLFERTSGGSALRVERRSEDSPGGAVATQPAAQTLMRARQSFPAVSRRPSNDPRWLDAALGAAPLASAWDRIRAGAKARLVRVARGVRPRFWVALAASVLAVGIGLVVMSRAGAEGVAGSGAVPSSPSATDVRNGAGDTGQAASDGGATGDGEPGQAGAGLPGELPEDPVVALPMLLAERARCFADLSALCLDAVDQPSSALHSDDTAVILGALTDPPAGGDGDGAGDVPEVGGRVLNGPFVASATALVERLGDAAIVNVTANDQPASVLMIRTEAGWRLRELYGE